LLDEILHSHCEMPAHGTQSEYGSGVISFSIPAANASNFENGVSRDTGTAPPTANTRGKRVFVTDDSVIANGVPFPKRK
jgi:hypothetical protein